MSEASSPQKKTILKLKLYRIYNAQYIYLKRSDKVGCGVWGVMCAATTAAA